MRKNPGMSDGGVGQHAFEVFLDDGHQVAEGHGDRRKDDQSDGEVIAGALGQDRQAQEQGLPRRPWRRWR